MAARARRQHRLCRGSVGARPASAIRRALPLSALVVSYGVLPLAGGSLGGRPAVHGAGTASSGVTGVAATGAAYSAGAASDYTTQAGSNLRDNWLPSAGVTSAEVGAPGFGELYAAPVVGQVYAQPLVWHGIVLVASEADVIEGVDAASGAVLWSRQVGIPVSTDHLVCGDMTPVTGITGTPVIDPATGIAYFIDKTDLSGGGGAVALQMQAVEMTTGDEVPGWPVTIQGRASNDPSTAFNPTNLISRPGLLLMDGVVYAGFGSLCDQPPFEGWIAGVSTATRSLTVLWTDAAFQQGTGGDSIWEAGQGLISDRPGQIVFATGNGTGPFVSAGRAQPPQAAFGNAVVRVAVGPGGNLRVVDFYAPSDSAFLSAKDLDVGSGGVGVVPVGAGSFRGGHYPELFLQGGKDGTATLLDGENLGGFAQGPHGGNDVVEELPNEGSIYSSPGFWPGDGGFAYLATTSPPGAPNQTVGGLYVYRWRVTPAGLPQFVLAASVRGASPYGSSSPVVTSSGTRSGSALVWMVERRGASDASSLDVYGAVPTSAKTLRRLWQSSGFVATKFEDPTLVGGRAYLGTSTQSGTGEASLLAFGPASARSPLSGPTTTFGSPSTPVRQGIADSRTVVLSATSPVEVTSVTATGGPWFSVSSVKLPATLRPGERLPLTASCDPEGAGTETGSLLITLSGKPPASLGLVCYGGAPSNAAVPSAAQLDFGVVAPGSGYRRATISFTNRSGVATRIVDLAIEGTGFTLAGPSRAGAMLAPGASVAIPVAFQPPEGTGLYDGTLTLLTASGSSSVDLEAGTAGGRPILALSAHRVDFGAVDVGASATEQVSVENLGTRSFVVTKALEPTRDGFSVTPALAPGTLIDPGARVVQTVRFAPTTTGHAGTRWEVASATGGAGEISLEGNGITAGTVAPPADGGWVVTGSAIQAGGSFELTDATTRFEAGSAFWPTPVPSKDLEVSFTAAIGGGTGADGEALMLATPSSDVTTIGGLGADLGTEGPELTGVAVGLSTYPSDHVGVIVGQSLGVPRYALERVSPVPLRGTPVRAVVTVRAGIVTLSLDGIAAFSYDAGARIGPRVLVGFTGANGSLADRHEVTDVSVATSPGGGA